MNREKLMSEVKDEYGKLADYSSKENFIDRTSSGLDNEVYYEKLLQDVLHEIQEGHFDDFTSGKDIVEAVANDKARLGIR